MDWIEKFDLIVDDQTFRDQQLCKHLDLVLSSAASEVLKDQTAVRLAERQERRSDWVMNQWGSRNGRVGQLIDLLESLQLFRPRDVILDCEFTADL